MFLGGLFGALKAFCGLFEAPEAFGGLFEVFLRTSLIFLGFLAMAWGNMCRLVVDAENASFTTLSCPRLCKKLS